MTAKHMLAGTLMSALILSGASAAGAEPVTLKARSGDFQISGELIFSDGTTITINAPNVGILMLEARRFDCMGAGCQVLGDTDAFSVQGSNTIGAALMPALVEAYATSARLRTEKRVGATPEEVGLDLIGEGGKKAAAIDLRSHGSGTAFPALAKGSAEIGASSRPIKAEEEKTIADAGLGINAHVLALDGILILVSPDNPVNELTLDQVAGIYSGQITDWSQLGGPAGAIAVYARDEKSGTTDTFNALVLGPRNLKLAAKAVRRESSSELSDEVAQDPRAIGFAGIAYLRNAKALSIKAACGITTAPTQFNVKTEEYPLSRRLFLYTTTKIASPHAKALLAYSLSDAAQPTVLSSGFIDQAFDALTFRQQSERITSAFAEQNDEFNMDAMKQLVTLITDARRLTATYRFEKNEYQLDLKAKQDAVRLARYLETPEMRGKEVLLIGFADAAGPYDANRVVSLARADTVRAAVLAAGGNRIDARRILARGYSETLPVDCNGTPEGRAKNRRVEVWVRDVPSSEEATSSTRGQGAARQRPAPDRPPAGSPAPAPRATQPPPRP